MCALSLGDLKPVAMSRRRPSRSMGWGRYRAEPDRVAGLRSALTNVAAADAAIGEWAADLEFFVRRQAAEHPVWSASRSDRSLSAAGTAFGLLSSASCNFSDSGQGDSAPTNLARELSRRRREASGRSSPSCCRSPIASSNGCRRSCDGASVSEHGIPSVSPHACPYGSPMLARIALQTLDKIDRSGRAGGDRLGSEPRGSDPTPDDREGRSPGARRLVTM